MVYLLFDINFTKWIQDNFDFYICIDGCGESLNKELLVSACKRDPALLC